jgi:hypothetical protein
MLKVNTLVILFTAPWFEEWYIMFHVNGEIICLRLYVILYHKHKMETLFHFKQTLFIHAQKKFYEIKASLIFYALFAHVWQCFNLWGIMHPTSSELLL